MKRKNTLKQAITMKQEDITKPAKTSKPANIGKQFALGLTAILVAVSFCACSKPKDNETANTNLSNETQVTQTVTPTAEPTNYVEDAVKVSPTKSAEPTKQAKPTTTAKPTTAAKPTKNPIPDATQSLSEEDETLPDDILITYLNEISEFYYPGTAGCSLVAIKYAGEILDWNEEKQPTSEVIKLTASTFVEPLGIEAREELPEKINSIYNAAKQLLEDNAKDALDSAGYEAKSYPWSEDTITKVFTAIYEGLGLNLPAEE